MSGITETEKKLEIKSVMAYDLVVIEIIHDGNVKIVILMIPIKLAKINNTEHPLNPDKHRFQFQDATFYIDCHAFVELSTQRKITFSALEANANDSEVQPVQLSSI